MNEAINKLRKSAAVILLGLITGLICGFIVTVIFKKVTAAPDMVAIAGVGLPTALAVAIHTMMHFKKLLR